jgi:signal transduction histidine kinase
LLVLPAMLLGALVWVQIARDHSRALEGLPARAERAAQLFGQTLRARVEALLAEESRRAFTDFAAWVAADRSDPAAGAERLAPSPLVGGPATPPVLGWFGGRVGSTEVGFASRPGAKAEQATASSAAFAGLLERYERLSSLERLGLSAFRPGAVNHRDLGLVLLQSLQPGDPELAQRMQRAPAAELRAVSALVQVGDPLLELVTDPAGQSHLFAWRRVTVERLGLDELGFEPPAPLTAWPQTLAPLLQATELDLSWLLEQLPEALAREQLEPGEALFRAGAAIDPSRYPAQSALDLFALLPFRSGARPESPAGRLVIAIDQEPLLRTHRAQMWSFLGLTLLLFSALAVGLSLLITDVRRKLERAEKMDNFVSAVTHELRTPLSTIALHTEMLLDGYATTPERTEQYLRRVDSETRRLSGLVEGVLEKSALSRRRAGPLEARSSLGDLNQAVIALQPALLRPGQQDLVFELAPGLPAVRLSPEALASILINLVENARKYAPVKPGGEPILVRTAAEEGGALLEVLDRGPGIPEEERGKVFEAFYRIGNERTRRARGTGLGLHLVDLQAKSLGGRVELLGRPGGGAWFRLHLRAF